MQTLHQCLTMVQGEIYFQKESNATYSIIVCLLYEKLLNPGFESVELLLLVSSPTLKTLY